MEERKRSILIPDSEKLRNMSVDEVDSLMRHLGDAGLNPVLREKNYTPELLSLPEEAVGHLGILNYREFEALIKDLGIQTIRPWAMLGRYRPFHVGQQVHDFIKKADTPFYILDFEVAKQTYAEAKTRNEKQKVLDRITVEERLSFEYLDARELIDGIRDGSLAQYPGVGPRFFGAFVDIANNRIRAAIEATPAD